MQLSVPRTTVTSINYFELSDELTVTYTMTGGEVSNIYETNFKQTFLNYAKHIEPVLGLMFEGPDCISNFFCFCFFATFLNFHSKFSIVGFLQNNSSRHYKKYSLLVVLYYFNKKVEIENDYYIRLKSKQSSPKMAIFLDWWGCGLFGPYPNNILT